MNTIWKWELTGTNTELQMPYGAQVLTVQLQDKSPQLWALVDSKQPTTKRIFNIYGTGYAIPTDKRIQYIATFQTEDILVWHVFEIPDQE